MLAVLLSSCAAPPEVDRVVLVTIDTLRADHLGSYGYPRPVSPFLDSLAERGTLFHNAASAASQTGPSHASIFTGLYPPQHLAWKNGVEPRPGLTTLADMLDRRGFETAAFVSVTFLKSLRQGFGRFRRLKEPGESYRQARQVTPVVEKWLTQDRRSDRFFLWVHYYDVHEWHADGDADPELVRTVREGAPVSGPDWLDYLRTRQGVTLDSYESPKQMVEAIDRYDAQILGVDRELERLFRAVEERSFAGTTLWIVTSDHGEGLGAHGYRGHGRFLYEEQLRVPLILYFSNGRGAGQAIEPLVRLVDLLPTVAELVGTSLAGADPPVEGRSLVSWIDGTDAAPDTGTLSLAERAWVDPENPEPATWEIGSLHALQDLRHKYILRSHFADEFYDLQQDPLELRNLIDEPSEAKEMLRRQLHSRLLAMRRQVGTAKRDDVGDEYLEDLRALGYLN